MLHSLERIEELGRRSQQTAGELIGGKRSSCWAKAWADVPDMCARLDSNGRKLLGLRLAACHLSDAGVDSALQCDSLDVDGCVGRIAGEPLLFQIYTEYFLNGVALCYLAESQRIKSSLSEGMGDLLSSAALTATMLADFEQRLHSTQGGMGSLQQFFARFCNSFAWLKGQIEELESAMRVVSNNVGVAKTAAFYGAFVVLALVASTPQRTSGCRFWLIVGVLCAVAAEWLAAAPLTVVCSWLPASVLGWWGGDVSSLVRLALAGYTVLVTAAAALTWRNIPVENNTMIQRLLREAKASRAMLYRP